LNTFLSNTQANHFENTTRHVKNASTIANSCAKDVC
jgi:hypothetical protein